MRERHDPEAPIRTTEAAPTLPPMRRERFWGHPREREPSKTAGGERDAEREARKRPLAKDVPLR